MSNISPPIDAVAVFKSWRLQRVAQRGNGLSPRSLDTYQSLWNTWCQYLMGAGVRPWNEARSVDVRGFLESLSPRAQLRGLQQPSTVTQRRYYRVLKEIYAHARAQGWTDRNPADARASVSPNEQKDSLVFHVLDWQTLLLALPRPQDPPPSGEPWLAVRDQALLRLMMEAGLTVAELAALDLGDVSHPRLGLSQGMAELWPETEADTTSAVSLELRGTRAAQRRRVALPAHASVAVLAWLSVRATLPVPQAVDSPLFVSRKQAGRLTPRALFHVANRHISETLAPRYPGSVLAHAGPMTLRNSCIVRWLDAGMPEDEVLARAGLRESQALLRLHKHVRLGEPAFTAAPSEAPQASPTSR